MENLQQKLYDCILARPLTDSDDDDDCITLDRKGFISLFKPNPNVAKSSLLPHVLASGVLVDNIKTIKATLKEVTTSDWESFNILTTRGAVIQEILGWAHYSPVIHQLIEQKKLLKLR